MKRWVAWLAVCAVFAVGVAVGALGMHAWDLRARAWTRDGGDPHAGGRSRFLDRMSERLALTAEQVAAIDAILAEGRAEAEALRNELGPRVRARMDATHRRIEEVLTPEQRAEFRQMLHKHRRRAERWMLGPPPGPPPDGPPPEPPGGPAGP